MKKTWKKAKEKKLTRLRLPTGYLLGKIPQQDAVICH